MNSFDSFIATVWEQGSLHARESLPWRYQDDPYAVYVSEAMLQQTQVKRVLNYWDRWMDTFPTIDSLAAASTSDVLERWQGLGYNRRALALKRTAEICASDFGGRIPCDEATLLSLPGIGPATAAGILVFAFQKPAVYIETNVRAVYIHHFFPNEDSPISDRQIAPLVRSTCQEHDPRGWYYALLDYGVYLKSSVVNPARKSSAYVRQSAFSGSRRQKRAFIVREVLAQPGITQDALFCLLCEEEKRSRRGDVSEELYHSLINELASEGFFSICDNKLLP